MTRPRLDLTTNIAEAQLYAATDEEARSVENLHPGYRLRAERVNAQMVRMAVYTSISDRKVGWVA